MEQARDAAGIETLRLALWRMVRRRRARLADRSTWRDASSAHTAWDAGRPPEHDSLDAVVGDSRRSPFDGGGHRRRRARASRSCTLGAGAGPTSSFAPLPGMAFDNAAARLALRRRVL
jgi:hypothetical protein